MLRWAPAPASIPWGAPTARRTTVTPAILVAAAGRERAAGGESGEGVWEEGKGEEEGGEGVEEVGEGEQVAAGAGVRG